MTLNRLIGSGPDQVSVNGMLGDLAFQSADNVSLGDVLVDGDITLDDGAGTFVTTLQTITATANRTISLPDATGTVALVAGSSGQLVWNSAGAYAGVPGSVVGATGDLTLALNGAASTPPLEVTGTWFTGGTSTTTKPQVLIEPTGATSTAWSTSGTGLGVNAASGFVGRLLDLQLNGTSRAVVTGAGQLLVGTSTAPSYFGGSPGFSVNGTGNDSFAAIARYNSANSFGAELTLLRSRSGTVGTQTVVQSGDNIGSISFLGSDGSAFVAAARIFGEVDGTPGANDMPGRLVFSTTADGAATLTERLRIDSAGQIEAGSLGTAAAPVWSFLADPNTGMWSPAADTLAASTNGTERLRITSTGNVGIGTTGPLYPLHVERNQEDLLALVNTGIVTYRLQVKNDASLAVVQNSAERLRVDPVGRLLVGTSTARISALHTARLQLEGNDFNSSTFAITSTENGSFGSSIHLNKIVGTSGIPPFNSVCGRIQFNGYDGTNLIANAHISAEVDGTPGANDMPGRLVFATTADGAASPTERLRITSTGQVRLAGAGITFNGDTATANELDDYEEGVWIPTQGTFDTWTSPTFNATYTKIGRLVHINLRQTAGTIGWSTGDTMGGLPFVPGTPSTSYATDDGFSSDNGVLLIWTDSTIYFRTANASESSLVFSAAYRV